MIEPAEGTTCGSQKIHDKMTPEELMRIFGISLADEVPEYEAVPIYAKSLDKNNGIYITLNPFGKNLKMWLTPNDGILAGEDMPIVSLKTNKQGLIDITKYSGFIRQALPKLYENKLYAATFAVNNHRTGRMSLVRRFLINKSSKYESFVGDYYVQPVPSRLVKHARRQARAIDDSFDHEEYDHVYHFVHKIPNSKMNKQAGK
ncbi:Protein of unknown function [Cotesia congregata]|uniref:Uncharacterized protein n=1 Tax=Cotesia congregata TaxID=51543 RepID=A0A8J2HCZ0_COTCN|nr:Protein of unknown function [Cotesia congregata]